MGELWVWTQKILMEAPIVVSNSLESYPRTKLYGLMDELFISNLSNHTDLCENLKGNTMVQERVPL